MAPDHDALWDMPKSSLDSHLTLSSDKALITIALASNTWVAAVVFLRATALS